MTPLHVASSKGSLAVAKCLINAGADLRSLDEEQMTPLHFACMEGSLEVAQLLFETGECDGNKKACYTIQGGLEKNRSYSDMCIDVSITRPEVVIRVWKGVLFQSSVLRLFS